MSAAYELIEPLAWEICGPASETTVAGFRANAAGAGVELRLHPDGLPGFLRRQ